MDSRNLGWQLDLAGANTILARNGGDPAARWALVVTTLRRLNDERRLSPQHAAWLADAEADLAKLKT